MFFFWQYPDKEWRQPTHFRIYPCPCKLSLAEIQLSLWIRVAGIHTHQKHSELFCLTRADKTTYTIASKVEDHPLCAWSDVQQEMWPLTLKAQISLTRFDNDTMFGRFFNHAGNFKLIQKTPIIWSLPQTLWICDMLFYILKLAAKTDHANEVNWFWYLERQQASNYIASLI